MKRADYEGSDADRLRFKAAHLATQAREAEERRPPRAGDWHEQTRELERWVPPKTVNRFKEARDALLAGTRHPSLAAHYRWTDDGGEWVTDGEFSGEVERSEWIEEDGEWVCITRGGYCGAGQVLDLPQDPQAAHHAQALRMCVNLLFWIVWEAQNGEDQGRGTARGYVTPSGQKLGSSAPFIGDRLWLERVAGFEHIMKAVLTAAETGKWEIIPKVLQRVALDRSFGEGQAPEAIGVLFGIPADLIREHRKLTGLDPETGRAATTAGYVVPQPAPRTTGGKPGRPVSGTDDPEEAGELLRARTGMSLEALRLDVNREVREIALAEIIDAKEANSGALASALDCTTRTLRRAAAAGREHRKGMND